MKIDFFYKSGRHTSIKNVCMEISLKITLKLSIEITNICLVIWSLDRSEKKKVSWGKIYTLRFFFFPEGCNGKENVQKLLTSGKRNPFLIFIVNLCACRMPQKCSSMDFYGLFLYINWRLLSQLISFIFQRKDENLVASF